MLLALLPSRRYFDRRASLLHETLTPGWVTSIALVFLGTLWLGIFSEQARRVLALAVVEICVARMAVVAGGMVGAAVVLVAAGATRFVAPGRPAGTRSGRR